MRAIRYTHTLVHGCEGRAVVDGARALHADLRADHVSRAPVNACHAPAMADEVHRTYDESELYARYVHVARAYFVRYGARDDEDLAHEAVLVAIAALRDGRVRDPARVGGYLLGVCRNVVRDRARRDARAERALAREQASAAAFASTAVSAAASTALSTSDARVDAFKLWGCVNGLSARARDVVLRTWVHDDDVEAIAAAHATTAGNVRVLRHRALAALLECLERSGGAG